MSAPADPDYGVQQQPRKRKQKSPGDWRSGLLGCGLRRNVPDYAPLCISCKNSPRLDCLSPLAARVEPGAHPSVGIAQAVVQGGPRAAQ